MKLETKLVVFVVAVVTFGLAVSILKAYFSYGIWVMIGAVFLTVFVIALMYYDKRQCRI